MLFAIISFEWSLLLLDGAVVRGAGAFEAACHIYLKKLAETEVKGRVKLGVEAFADAMLIIPKVLVENSGLDRQEALITLLVILTVSRKS